MVVVLVVVVMVMVVISVATAAAVALASSKFTSCVQVLDNSKHPKDIEYSYIEHVLFTNKQFRRLHTMLAELLHRKILRWPQYCYLTSHKNILQRKCPIFSKIFYRILVEIQITCCYSLSHFASSRVCHIVFNNDKKFRKCCVEYNGHNYLTTFMTANTIVT